MPIFEIKSLPVKLIVLLFTVITLQVFAEHDDNLMLMMSTPFMSMLLFSKHL